MDAGQLRLVGLTLVLPEEAKVKARQNFQTSIWKKKETKKWKQCSRNFI